MTAPTIIQTPGAIDTAVSGFMQAYQVARSLADRRRELDLQAKRVQSATDLEASQRKNMENDLQNSMAQHTALAQANNVFAGQAASNGLSDPGAATAFAADKLKDVPGGMGAWGQLYNQHTQGAYQTQLMEQARQQAALDRERATQLEHERIITGQVHDILSHYEGQDVVNNPQVQARAIADIWTVDPDQAMKQMQAFNQMRGKTSVTALDDGSVLVQNDNGQWHVAAHAWGGKMGAGGGLSAQVSAEQRLTGARQAIRFLQRANQIYLIDKDGVTEPPAVTVAEQGVGFIRKALGQGAGETTAQMLRTQHQQNAQMFAVGFVDNYNKTILGTGGVPRNMQYQTNFRRIYFPIGPLKGGVAEQAYQNRLDMIGDLQRFIGAIQRGVPDPTSIRGASDLISAEHQLDSLTAPSDTGDFSQQPWNPNR